MSKEDFQARYKGKSRERYQKAIRAEMPGGNELLDLMELTSSMRHKARGEEEAERLRLVEDGLQGIRDAMVNDVCRNYGMEEFVRENRTGK